MAATPASPDAPSPQTSARRRRGAYGSDVMLARRERMLQAAKELIAEHGAQGFTIRQISERAGASVTTIYATYGDKEGLLAAAIVDYYAKLPVASAPPAQMEPMATASMNGGDLLALGLQPGDVVTLRTRRGGVALHARRDDGTPAGAVFVPFAYYEAAANLMTNAALDPFGKIPEFKYCAVKVVPGGQPQSPAGYGTGATGAPRSAAWEIGPESRHDV